MNATKTTCIYCNCEVTEIEEVPEVSDSEAWSYLADEHASDCEWIATRAHRVNE